MKKSLLASILGLSVLTIGTIFSFTSCEVGLGPAVDTEAPVPVFADNTIGTGAVIRDAFIVHGTWADDGEINELKATLTSTSGTNLAFTADGTVETESAGKGTWSVVFDPITSGIPDGSYELSLTMTDTGKHASTITRSLVVDNTPPLVVLTRPGTKLNDSSFDSYGQKFSLEGKAADDNDVSLVEVNVYEDAARTTLLKTIPISNVPLTIDLDVAEFSETEVNDYTAIYNILQNGLADKEGGTATRYCSLNIYDGSQRYPADGSAQTAADKLGNHTSTYYVNDDTIAELFTQYKITELYHIMNKSFGSSSGRSISVDSVKTKLAQQAITGSQFTINPENSPTFVVNSRSPLENGENLDEAKYQITSGLNTLQVEISAGLDKHAIKKDTIGIYVRECDNLGVVVESAPKIWLVRPAPIEGETNPDAQAGAHDADKVEIVQSGTTYKFTTVNTLTPVNFTGLDVNKYYKVFVVGKDVMKNSVQPKDSAVYAFNLKPDTQVINLSVTNVTPDWLSTSAEANAASKEYKAKVTFNGGDALNYTVFRKFDTGDYVSLGVQTSPFWDTFKTIDETNHPGETWAPSVITYQVKGNNDSISSELPLTERQYDDTKPVVVLPEDGIPTVTDTQQATITFKGTASDKNGSDEESGVKAVYVQIIDEATGKETPAYGEDGAIKASYSGGEWLCQIKPSDYSGSDGAFADEGPKRVIVTAVDGVGLTQSVTVDSTDKVNEKHFVYDSAVPKIVLSDYRVYKSPTEWENSQNLKNNESHIVGKLFKVTGTISEMYGIDSGDFTITQKFTSTDENTTSNVTEVIDLETTPVNAKVWSITLPLKDDGTAYDNETITGSTNPADGTYEYEIKAKDKAGKSDNDGIKFTFVLNTKGPVVKVTAPKFSTTKPYTTEDWQQTRDIMISGEAFSPATIKAIYWTTDGTKEVGTAEESSWSGWTPAKGSNNWNFTVSFDNDSEEDNKVYIAAIDNLDNVTAKETYILKVDSTAPDMSPKFYKIGDDGEIQPANGTIYISGITQKDLTVYGTWGETISGPYAGEDNLKPLAFTMNGTAKSPDITYSNTDITSGVGTTSFTAASATTSTKSWQAVFTASTLAEGPFVVTARNGSSLSRDNSDLRIQKDSEAPKFGDQISITKSSYDKKVTTSGVDTFYYYVNNKEVTTISGSAEDSNLLSVEIEATSIGKDTITDKTTSNPYNWSFDLDMTDDDWPAETDVLLTVTDKAGNTETKKLKLVFDTTPPLAKHEWDKKDKDLYFRVGESDNELSELQTWATENSTTISALDSALDKNVGGKYLNGTFGNAETIRIRGDFEDGGSGLSAIYYKVFEKAPSDTQVNAFVASPETEKTGSAIAPSDVEQRVSYTDPSDNKKKFKKVHTSFSTLVSGLKANGNNYIVIVAVDKVGNVGLDYAEKSNYDGASSTKPYSATKIEDSYYTLNIDTINVENTVDDDVDTTGYVNPALDTCSDITISGVATSGKDDNGNFPSVISDVFIELKVNGKVITTTDSENGIVDVDTSSEYTVDATTTPPTKSNYTKYNAHWIATIKPKVVFSGVNSGQYPVYAIVSDGAGNKQTFTVAQINIDKNAPTVKINNISDADKTTPAIDVNGTLTLEGTVTEKESFDSVKIEYKKTTDTSWTTLATKTDTTWSAELNTTSLPDTTEYDILVTASDKAGNTGYASTKIYVNQDSDRPIVKVTNLTKGDDGKFILKYGTNASLEGTVTDDDATSEAVVTKFLASKDPINSATGWENVKDNQNNPTNTWKHIISENVYEQVDFNPATGDFTFTPADKNDGPKDVYFYIENNKDNNTNKKYYTNSTEDAELTRPKTQYKTDAPEDNDEALSYKSDSNAPKIKAVELKAYTAASGDNTQTGSATALGSNCIVGGPSKKYVDINVTANDHNGIKGIVVILEQAGKDTIYYRSNTIVSEADVAASGYTDSTEVDSSTTSDDYTYSTSRLDISDYDEAPVNVTIKVYDQSGLYSNQESMFVVDNTAPTLTIENVKDGDVVYGIKKNTVGGTINGATDVEAIYYAVTNDINVSDWVKSKTYAVDDVVIHGGKYYKCSTAHTSGEEFDSTKWTEDIPSLVSGALWTLVTGQKISAKIIFGGTNADSSTGQITKSLREYLMDIYGYDADEMLANDDNLNLSIHFKAVDACGNTGYSTCTLEVVPNGDKPTITLSYPVDISVTKNGVTTIENPALAGTIRIYGNAEVAEGSVAAVYVQIDTNYVAANGFNADGWETGFNSCISGKGTTYTVEKIGNKTIRGVKATGTLNWNLPINGNKEFNPTGNSRSMAIRIYGVGGSGKVSEYVEQVFTVDPNAPHIGGDGTVTGVMQLKLVQLDNSGNVTNQRPYKSGDWVTGQWYVAASVYDDSGIRSITLDQNDGYDKIKIVDGAVKKTAHTRKNQADYQLIKVEDNSCAAAIGGATGKSNFDIYIPLPTAEGSGSVNFTIEAVEVAENANSSTENIKINYDNTPPKLGTVGHESYNSNAYNVRQDNGFYRIFGYATDTEAGSVVSDMKAVAFYFVRRGTANTRVYDPMWKNKSVSIQTGTNNTAGITYEYGMFWNTKTVGRSSTNLSELTLTTKDDNIHAGGFVLMDGTIYTISTVSADGKTITLKTEAPAGITTAKFAYAMVIDNFNMTESTDDRQKETDSSKYGYGYYKADSTADDGDLMQEKWASGQWDAWINSANIPDGPIEIHYVALDNAQNYSVGIVGNLSYADYKNKTTLDVAANGNKATASNNLISGFDYIYDADKKAYVSNNAPRIAGVKVGCDYDGNGSISDKEKTTKYVATETIYGSGGTSTTRITDVISEFEASVNGAPLMTVKDKISIEIEIIGGNGNIYNQYNIDTTKKTHTNISDWSKFNNLKYYTTNDLETEINYSTVTDNTPVYTKEAFKWLDVKGETNATNTYYTDEALTTKATTSTEDETVVYAKKSYTWKNANGRLGSVIRAADEGLSGSYYTTTTLPSINFTNAQLVDALGGADADNGTRWFTVELWDSTEETTPYSNSQYAALKLPLDLQVNDKTAPNTVFNDLYWNSAADNSVYRDSNGKIHGHIELISDLTYEDAGVTKTTTLGTTYGVDDDKISGLITFKGYAYDNKRLASLKWGIKNALSGTIKEAWPQIYITAAEFTGGTWSTAGSAGIGLPYYYLKVYDDAAHGAYLDEHGHKVYWELTIDTSRVQEPGESVDEALAVGKDLYVYMVATDGAGKTTNMNPAEDAIITDRSDAENLRPNYKVDVVPYITGVKTRLSRKNKSNPEVYSRTARGHYPIASDETAAGSVVLQGYNLSTGNADVDISSIISTQPTGAYVYTRGTGTNAVMSINNMNYNDAHGDYDLSDTTLTVATKAQNMYNRTPSTVTNLTLTDDVFFDIWEFKKAASPKYGRIKEPVMRINPTNGMIGFAFANAADAFSMPNGSDNSYVAWQKNYADYKGINFVYDKNGRVHSLSTGMDTEPNNGYAGYMQYILSSWGGNGIGNMYNWNGNVTAALESIGLPVDTYIGGTKLTARVIDVDRFGTPSMAVAGTNRVYLAYYDSDNDQIRFRYGTVQETKGSRNNDNGQLSDGDGSATTGAIGNDTGAGATNYGQHSAFEADPARYSLIAGKTQGASPEDTGNGTSEFVALDVIAGEDPAVNGIPSATCTTAANTRTKTASLDGFTLTNNAQILITFENQITNVNNQRPQLNVNNTGAKEIYNNGTRFANNTTVAAGTYLATYNGTYWNLQTPVYSNYDIVVIVWFDGNNLMYTYRYGDKDDTDCLSAGVANKWAQPQVIFHGVGHYCTIKVDKNNGIHIAAYNRTGADLYYCYMSSYDDYANKKTALIDSYSQVGKYISLDTALVLREGSTTEYNVVPYITYYGDGFEGLPKLAYLPGGINKDNPVVPNGADNDTDLFTGEWEVSLIPTQSEVNEDNMNIALWKTSAGVLTSSGDTRPDNFTDPTITSAGGTTSETANSATWYGNGTSKLVLGYGIVDNATGFIEIAQMKN